MTTDAAAEALEEKELDEADEPRFCSSCIFWREMTRLETGRDDMGACLYEPPRAFPTIEPRTGQLGVQNLRPISGAKDFCSHHARDGESYGEEILSLPVSEMIVPIKEIAFWLRALAEKPGKI